MQSRLLYPEKLCQPTLLYPAKIPILMKRERETSYDHRIIDRQTHTHDMTRVETSRAEEGIDRSRRGQEKEMEDEYD